MTRTSLLTFLAMLAGAAACGGASSSIGGGVTTEQATTDAANAYCSRAQACAPAYVTLGYGDVATCATRYQLVLATSFGGSGSAETAAQIEACAQAIPGTTCAELLGRNPPTACQTVAGTLADGSPCASDAQCKGAHCHVPANQTCGTCGEAIPAGGACVTDDDCDYGMGCTSSVCVPYGSENAACTANTHCRPDLGCVNGTCTAPSPTGAACSDSTACNEPEGDFCNPLNMQCTATSFAATGAACGLVSNSLVLCTGPGSMCTDSAANDYKGTCQAYAADGAACDTTNGPYCDVGAVCMPSSATGTAGTCTVPNPNECH